MAQLIAANQKKKKANGHCKGEKKKIGDSWPL